MTQLYLGLNLSTKRTRKRDFLDQTRRVVPWPSLISVYFGMVILLKNTEQHEESTANYGKLRRLTTERDIRSRLVLTFHILRPFLL